MSEKRELLSIEAIKRLIKRLIRVIDGGNARDND